MSDTQENPHGVISGEHAAMHFPISQNGVAPLQVTPHAPQLFGSLSRDRQSPSHAWVPLGHAHAPLTQLVLPEQASPQAPQFFGSDDTSVQPLAHASCPGAPQEHSPSTHG
ncbi:MAG TPA: hypothetical protein VFQ35_05850 [Polyangiaceae bacterium]|nr:hypothetical protein [Polyangiaceae bacterium]